MLFLKDPNQRELNPHQEAIAQKVARKIIKVQAQVAMWLNKKTAKFSRVQKQIMLLIISTIFSGISLYLIFNSIS